MQYLGIAISQLIMFGILIAIFSKSYIYQCIFIVICQLIFLILYKVVDYCPIEIFKKWLAKDFITEEEEEEHERKVQIKIQNAMNGKKTDQNDPLLM